jgi:LPXTG-motif cell wall-anchored protein
VRQILVKARHPEESRDQESNITTPRRSVHVSAETIVRTTECPSPYVENCILPSETTTTTIAVPRELPETGSDATATIGFAGVILVTVGLIAAIAGRRRATA